MNGRLLAGALALLLGLAGRAAEAPPAALNTLFAEARAAYDAGDAAKAAGLYRQIAASGWTSPALCFNLGNACYRLENYGEAILNYRRTLLLTPGDADARANLQMAVQRTGAAIPEPWLVPELLRQVSRRGWTGLALAAWWLSLLLLAARLLVPRLPLRAPAVLAAGAAVMALAFAGRWVSHDLARTAEAVMLRPGELLSAPVAGSATLVKLPEGSLVDILEDGGSWLRVRSGKDSGWTPAAKLGRVRP